MWLEPGVLPTLCESLYGRVWAEEMIQPHTGAGYT